MINRKENLLSRRMFNLDTEKELGAEQRETLTEICRLAAVVNSRKGLIFLGWGRIDENRIPSGPTISPKKENLVGQAKASYENAKTSGVKLREVDCPQITPFDYVTFSGIIDYTGENEDLVSLLVKDEEGEVKTLTLPEKRVLKAFSDARKFWQDTDLETGLSKIGERETARKMFTPIVGSPNVDGPDLAILIPPSTGGSNEFDFKIVMIKVLGKILQSDREQSDEGEKKGFDVALTKFAQRRSYGDLEGILGVLEIMGIIHSKDNFLEYLDKRQRRGEKVGFDLASIFIKKPALERIRRSASTGITLDKLEIDQLCDLAEEMYNIAIDWVRKREQGRPRYSGYR